MGRWKERVNWQPDQGRDGAHLLLPLRREGGNATGEQPWPDRQLKTVRSAPLGWCFLDISQLKVL